MIRAREGVRPRARGGELNVPEVDPLTLQESGAISD